MQTQSLYSHYRILSTAFFLLYLASSQATGAALQSQLHTPQIQGSVLKDSQDNTLYNLLVAEFSAEQGDNNAAFNIYYERANALENQALFKRAVALAIRKRSSFDAMRASKAWVAKFPTSLEARAFQIKFLTSLNQLGDFQDVLAQSIKSVSPEDQKQLIRELPVLVKYTSQPLVMMQAAQAVIHPADMPSDTAAIAWASLGKIALQAEKYDDALKDAIRAHQLQAHDKSVAYLVLDLLAIPSTRDTAQKLATTYLSGRPSADILQRLMQDQIKHKAFEQGLVTAKRFADLYPESSDAWFALGGLSLAQKYWKESAEAFDKFLALESNLSSMPNERMMKAWQWGAQIACHEKDYTRALSMLNEIPEGANTAQIELLRANILAASGQEAAARQIMHRVVHRMKPELMQATIMEQVLQSHDIKAMLQLLMRYLEKNSGIKNYELLMDLAKVANDHDAFDVARTLLMRAIYLQPKNAEAYNTLGYMLLGKNNGLDEAKIWIDKAITLSPTDPYVMDSQGWLKYQQGDLQGALLDLTTAWKKTKDPEIAVHLAEILVRLGQQKEVTQLLQEALVIHPDNAQLLDMSKKVGQVH